MVTIGQKIRSNTLSRLLFYYAYVGSRRLRGKLLFHPELCVDEVLVFDIDEVSDLPHHMLFMFIKARIRKRDFPEMLDDF